MIFVLFRGWNPEFEPFVPSRGSQAVPARRFDGLRDCKHVRNSAKIYLAKEGAGSSAWHASR